MFKDSNQTDRQFKAQDKTGNITSPKNKTNARFSADEEKPHKEECEKFDHEANPE